jgi:penicillin-binding protein 1A
MVAAWIGGGVVGILALLLLIAVALVWPELPDLDQVEHYQPHQPLKIVTRDDVEIGEFGPERRIFVPIAQIPKILQDAVIATEDADFRTHAGVSVKGTVRAFLVNLRHERSQGGSTITQQVARNFYLTRRKSYVRKFSEILLALKMERALSKDQILELYMNQIYLGQHAYGFEAASQMYFGKPSAQLSIAEAAMLAGLPQNPYYANPISHMDRAVARQHVVLQRMLETGVIDERQYAAAKVEKLVVSPHDSAPVTGDFIAEMVRQQVVERYGDQAYSQGLKVTTSILSTDQLAAVAAVRKGILEFDRRQAWRGPEDTEELPDDDNDIEQAAAAALKEHPDDDELHVAIVLHASPKQLQVQLANGERATITGDGLRLVQAALKPDAPSQLAVDRGAILRLVRAGEGNAKSAGWQVAQWPDVEAALVSMDTHTGQVRALVGGFDFRHGKFNHVTSAWRQPGSSFKPFIYSAALEQGVMPATIINDAPLQFDEAAGGGAHWQPRNSDGKFDGPITLRQALARSKNLVSVRLVQTIGIDTVRDWAARFGLDRDKQPPYLTIALGAGSVTPAQMVDAYAVFANGGYRVTPRFIEKITDAQGHVLFEAPAAPALTEDRRVIPERNAFVMDQLLNEVTRSGTAAKAQALLKRPDLYGKTGTTNDAVDAWFAGFQPSLAAVVWMGRDDPSSLGARESGGGLALPIWVDYMRQALKGVPVATLETPAGVSRFQDDWMYDEYLDGGYIQSIGVDARPLDEEPEESDQPPTVVKEPKGASGEASAPDAGGGGTAPPVGPGGPGTPQNVPALPLSTVPAAGPGREGGRPGTGGGPAASAAGDTLGGPATSPVH